MVLLNTLRLSFLGAYIFSEMSEGWIRLHRQFLDHWLCDEYRPLTRREAWENMLLWANYRETKVLIKGQLFVCGRGQLLYSLETWALKFNWSVGQVRRFFKLLEMDKMIIIEGLHKTTRLTICNYESYQSEQHANDMPTTCQRHADDTPTTDQRQQEKKEKKDKNVKKEKNSTTGEIFLGTEMEVKIDYDYIVDLYHNLCSKMSRVAVLNQQRKGFINARYSEFGMEKITSVLRLAGESKFLNGDNDRAWKADLEWIFRPVNFVKILEGKYTNRERVLETHEERIRRIAGV